MALQNFVDQDASTPIMAAWLNGVDVAVNASVQAAANAVASDLTSRLNRVLFLDDYMSEAQRTSWKARDGLLSMSSAFSNLLTDVLVSGLPTTVQLSAGKGVLTEQINCAPLEAIRFVGAGVGQTELVLANATSNMFRFGDGSNLRSFLGVSGMTLSASLPKSAGALISLNHVAVCHFSDLKLDAGFYGFQIVDSQVTVIEDVFITNTVSTTGKCLTASATGLPNHSGSNLYLIRVVADAPSGAQPACGVSIGQWDGVWMIDSQFNHSGFGFLAEPPTGTFFDHVFASGCSFDTGAGNGFTTQGLGVCRRFCFSNCWFGSNDNTGITLGSGALSMHFVNSRIVNNGTFGFYVTSATDWSLHGGMISGNSRASIGTYSGIKTENNQSLWKVMGVTVQAAGGFPNYQKYGIELGSSNSQFDIIGNHVRDNVTGSISNANTVNVYIAGNDGYKTANSGAGNVLTGSTSIGVTHGLPFTPALSDITVTMTNFTSSNKIRISNPTSSGFDVTVDVDPSTANQAFVWSVRSFQ